MMRGMAPCHSSGVTAAPNLEGNFHLKSALNPQWKRAEKSRYEFCSSSTCGEGRRRRGTAASFPLLPPPPLPPGSPPSPPPPPPRRTHFSPRTAPHLDDVLRSPPPLPPRPVLICSPHAAVAEAGRPRAGACHGDTKLTNLTLILTL